MPASPVAIKRAVELEKLAAFLARQGLAENTNELNKAASALRSAPVATTYSYRFEGLYFSVEAMRHTLPRNVRGIRAELKVAIEGQTDETIDDPYQRLAVNVILRGTMPDGTAMFTWHLDRDDGGSDSKDWHPRYHFQHAGQVMRSRHDAWGKSLLLESPRLMHPPLDGILAIDFVLGSYLSKRYQRECLSDPTYRSIIGPAQRRVWANYARAIASFNDDDDSWHKRCWPYWPQVLTR